MRENIRKVFILLLALNFFFVEVGAQESVEESVEAIEVIREALDGEDSEYKDMGETELVPVPIDTPAPLHRSFNQDQLEEYKKSGRFDYGLNPDYEDGFFKRLWKAFMRWLSEHFGYAGGKAFGQIVKWFLIISGMGLLLYFLREATGNSIVKKERRDKFVHLESLGEDVSEETLDELLAAAIANHEHRAAVRLYFLKCLRKLDDNDEIKWRDHKTNMEYLNELVSEELSVPFSNLVNIYEHVWYGEFDVSSSEYEKYGQAFRSFLNKLSTVSA